ncbi:hypothetical protein CR513_39390, partial [Mucuna pruriens]
MGSKSIAKQLAYFNKILDDLENIDVKLDDENKVLQLLNSIKKKSFEIFKGIILYGKDQTITLDEVQTSIQTKELQKLQNLKAKDNGDCLKISREKSEKRKSMKKKIRSKSQIISRMIALRKKARSLKSHMDSLDVAVALDCYKSVGVWMASTS